MKNRPLKGQKGVTSTAHSKRIRAACRQWKARGCPGMRAALLALCWPLGGCVVTGSFEIPTKYGTATIRSDGKTINAAIRLREGYAK